MSLLAQMLDKWMSPDAYHRWRSTEPKEGYVEDTLWGDYCESDETFRNRIMETERKKSEDC